jgi:phosphonate transport system ATP-binding protein
MSGKTLLSINKLDKSYVKGTPVLREISLDFHEGEFVVVIGPSGAGKSTFIRCLNRMIEPSGGAITFNGEETGSLKGSALRRMRSQIGMVFQHHNLVGRTNVIRNVLHGRLGQMPFWKSFLGLYSDEDKRSAFNLISSVGLSEQIHQRADALSGGQMQRVGICRAMVQNPKLLLADEPIASLDPKSADTVMESLHRLSTERGLTCIVNLHQVDFARRFATRIIGIRAGKVVFDGAPEALTDEVAAHIYEGMEHQMTLEAQHAHEKMHGRAVAV